MKTSLFLAAILLTTLYAITVTPTTESASITTRHQKHAAPISIHSLSLFPSAGRTMYWQFRQILIASNYNVRKARMCWAAIHNMDFYYCRADIRKSFINNEICMSEICCDAIIGVHEACCFIKNPFLAEFVKLHCSRPDDDNVVSPPSS